MKESGAKRERRGRFGTDLGTLAVPIAKQAGDTWPPACESSGGGEGSRTPDTGIFSPLLYQLSYPAIWCGNYYTKLAVAVKDFFLGRGGARPCAAEGARDPALPRGRHVPLGDVGRGPVIVSWQPQTSIASPYGTTTRRSMGRLRYVARTEEPRSLTSIPSDVGTRRRCRSETGGARRMTSHDALPPTTAPPSPCVSSSFFERNEHRKLSSLRTMRAQAF